MILMALGGNLPGPFGPPERIFQKLPAALEEQGVHVVALSDIWRSAPVPASDQPWYSNAVMAVETPHGPVRLLQILHEVEKKFGRDRDRERARNEPRILDLDLLAYHDEIVKSSEMILPHPRMHLRAFVLQPLNQIAPHWTHPVFQKSVPAMIRDLPKDQCIMKRSAEGE